jgi:hypothetical protein
MIVPFRRVRLNPLVCITIYLLRKQAGICNRLTHKRSLCRSARAYNICSRNTHIANTRLICRRRPSPNTYRTPRYPALPFACNNFLLIAMTASV